MAGRLPDPHLAQIEDNLANLSDIEQAVQVLLARLRTPDDLAEVRRILVALERIREREKARRAHARRSIHKVPCSERSALDGSAADV